MSTGEPSGDLYAALFVKSQLKDIPTLYGVGGENLKKTNVILIFDYENLKTFGFASGILSILKNFKMYHKIGRMLFKLKPEIFIAVAYPGINLLLCRYAKKLGIKTVYLLPPQIWAWGTFRKYFIRKWVDLIISVFPFEYRFYQALNFKVIYWANPLLIFLKDYTKPPPSREIGVMPGSRVSQVKRNLRVIKELIKNFPNWEFVFILHPEVLSPDLTRWLTHEFSRRIKIVSSQRYEAMCRCRCIITSSGTASLETAILNIPQIFFNYPPFPDYYLFRHFLRITEYNLTNLYYGKHIVPSFVFCNKKRLVQAITQELHRLLT
ncbi:MAG: hypothetical protein ABIL40_04695 [candidate division WOR-3 bacterium]